MAAAASPAASHAAVALLGGHSASARSASAAGAGELLQRGARRLTLPPERENEVHLARQARDVGPIGRDRSAAAAATRVALCHRPQHKQGRLSEAEGAASPGASVPRQLATR